MVRQGNDPSWRLEGWTGRNRVLAFTHGIVFLAPKGCPFIKGSRGIVAAARSLRKLARLGTRRAHTSEKLPACLRGQSAVMVLIQR